MKGHEEIGELNGALIANFRLKAKILSILFGTVLFFQLIVLFIVATQTDLPGKVIPYRMMIVGPSLLLAHFIAELLSFRYMSRVQQAGGRIRMSFVYLSTFVEVSFPCAIIFLSGNFLRGAGIFPPMQVVNSPLLVILFIMIILSSLLLNPRLCFFAGLCGGLEYLAINLLFLAREAVTTPIDYGNAALKSVFIIVSGLIAGFVSRKVREAVLSSLEAKNELIHHLDRRVAEKTAEVVAQKTEIEKQNRLLEEKQKEILDSIHYARRIQYTQLPTEKYISRILAHFKAEHHERKEQG
jgi:adenylate cyclase